jgi:hypothetical protein
VVDQPDFCYILLMPVIVIVGVHGIAKVYSGGFALITLWFDALRDGLAAAGFGGTADRCQGTLVSAHWRP